MTDLNPDQLGMLWDYWTEAYLPCLSAHGASVQTDYPTREAFIADFYSEQRWWAENNIPLTEWGERKLTEVYKACPVYPPTEYFFGS